jgi:hypothetical protein
LQPDLDDIQRRNAEPRDQPGDSASQHDLSFGAFIFEMLP